MAMENLAVATCDDGNRRPEVGAYRNVLNKTSSYTVGADDHGKVLTNSGAGAAVTFTLPVTGTAPGQKITGKLFIFAKVANQNLIVAVGTGARINNNTVSTGVFSNTTSSTGAIPTCEVIAISETEWIARPTIGTWANA